MSDMDDIVQEFLVESHEGLDRLDTDLVTLEQNPGDLDTLAGIFRTIHTIKGTCGFLGFNRLEKVAHVGESLLSLLRDGKLDLTPNRTSALLHLVDAVREMLAHIEAAGEESSEDYLDLIAKLEKLQSLDAANEESEPTDAPPSADEPPIVEAKADRKDAGDLAEAAIPEVPDQPKPTPSANLNQGDTNVAENKKASGGGENLANIRVNVGLLDELMNLVGELVLARNQILQFNKSVDDPNFMATTQRLNHITTELQEGVMKTRMQPIGSIWAKFPRVVRDLSLTCGKQVAISMEGKETELDRTLIEAIKDPLTHIVRNSVDHGIENPDLRVANGKPAEGILQLKAFHEGGQVIVEISDDGGGIDPEKLKAKALERNVLPENVLQRMSDHELVNLIFAAGFSTAEKVTNVSGRGVGMDVVRTNIEKIGGAVDIHSELGKGTTLKVKIPLTLAIIPALIVTCRDNRYAIPQVSLLELLLLEKTENGNGIEEIHGTPVYRLRGNLLPIVYLDEELGFQPFNGISHSRRDEDDINVVVLQAEDSPFGLVVDSVLDTEEIVVKPLAKQINAISCFAGATIMGDGKVALILDVMGLAQDADVLAPARDNAMGNESQESQDKSVESQTLLLFGIGANRRMAIDLSSVDRLEEIPQSSLAQTGTQEVVQYRGQIMPLVRLASFFGEMSPPLEDQDATLQVVVYSRGDHSIGLVVDDIIDIVRDTLEVKSLVSGPGISSSAVIQGHVTDILDVTNIVSAVHPEMAPSLQMI